MTATTQNWECSLVAVARVIFSVAIIFFGVQHFLYGAFVTRLVPSWPGGAPAGVGVVYGVGAVLIAIGLALLTGRTARAAALVLGGLLLASVVALYLPKAIPDVWWAGSWTATGKALVTLGGGFAVAKAYARNPAELSGAGRMADALAPLGGYLLAAFMLLAGIQHFVWDQFVATLVPRWIPPGDYFWTYAAGILLIAGGIGMIWRRTRHLAAGLSALMIFLWVPMLHIPRAIASSAGESNEWTAVFEALAFSAIAYLVSVDRSGERSGERSAFSYQRPVS